MATSPRQSAIATAMTTSRCEAIAQGRQSAACPPSGAKCWMVGTADRRAFAPLHSLRFAFPGRRLRVVNFTALHANSSRSIVLMLPTSSKCAPKPPRASWFASFGGRAHGRRHRQRHGARPVEPPPRQLFDAFRMRPAPCHQLAALPDEFAARAFARGDPDRAASQDACARRRRLSGNARGRSPSENERFRRDRCRRDRR